MSFFGFEEKTLERGRDNRRLGQDEDLAVYDWGEENYDGLGDALQEDHDDFNDETFGGAGDVGLAIGKDFDFSTPALPDRDRKDFARLPITRAEERPPHSEPNIATPLALESIWDDKSAFSMRLNGSNRTSSSPFLPRGESPAVSSQHRQQSGIRTLQEIEAEMRASVEQSRQEALLQQRQQQYYLEQRLLQKQREEEELLRQEEEREYQRQRLLYQQEQAQQQLQLQRLQQQQLLHQRDQHQHRRTPPPRMLPVSQSPRFMEHQQRQILYLQQQQEQQQLLRLQQLEEQLRIEEMERQLRSQHISSAPPDRQPSGPTLADMEALQHQQLQERLRQRSQSPATRPGSHRPAPLEDTLPYLPQSIQLQQRLLSEMAQAELLREIQGLSQIDQEALRVEAMRKILEAEKMEEKRRRKASKIAHMSRYNDLMTQSDKDFITRIQVSQLVSQDPYADDFYAQVYGAIVRSRMGLSTDDERVLKFGASGGVALGAPTKGGNRRPNAMQRMQQQVERIVSNARKREEEKGLHCNLQGALGKTSGRSYKAAPRQLLQVDSGSAPSSSPTLSHAQPHAHISKADSISKSSDAAANAARMGRETLSNGNNGEELVRMEPLTQREILVTLENMYDLVLNVEQLRRDQPMPEEGEEVLEQWRKDFDTLVDKMWTLLKVMLPLGTSTPHPFISLLSAAKGKKILPRVTRHFDQHRMNTLLTLLIACFSQLDVISQAALLDTLEDTPERADVERQTQAFLSSVLQSILPIIVKGNLRLVCGLVGLLMHGQDTVAIAKSRPGLALLTLFLTRVEVIKQGEVDEIPTHEDFAQWQLMFDHLFQLLTPEFPLLFPSTRMAAHLPRDQPHVNIPGIDSLDQPVWQFLAALALQASSTQHQILVSSLREKVLDNVLSAKKGWVVDEEERNTKLANVDLFLHALGLDSSQITM
ncbi:topoisomerase II-associated protein PAT1 [Lentinula raphanica]|uniref:Topoisomerase II-associated protein PAT1 n=1 Tax=Lentinula raphanica TaxID=153919 RepID=A0AA38PEA4_9AGAR|nr:topoisomerase II-associated protein PAT1 [Lentinula raphanica]